MTTGEIIDMRKAGLTFIEIGKHFGVSHQYAARKLLHQQKKIARDTVARALKKGSLTRPSKCERCPSTGYLEAHHDDYSKPLQVEWLCERCHFQIPTKRHRQPMNPATRERLRAQGRLDTAVFTAALVRDLADVQKLPVDFIVSNTAGPVPISPTATEARPA